MKVNKYRMPFLRQKIQLYFDANFPAETVEELRNERMWRKKLRIVSAYDIGTERRDDKYHFNYCRRKKYTLVTLDRGFMDDNEYPFSRIPGIIVVAAGKQQAPKIRDSLLRLLDFLSAFPFPRTFIGDTKFRVSPDRCVIRGRDAITGEVKTVTVKAGDSMLKVARAFHYLPD